jgi:NADPH:quinone reductase-like Zn-dependent oxidoreductase
LVPLPDDINDNQAAGMLLKGLTAQYLVRATYPVKSGETVLIHAAAGGVGLILCQWAKHLGATVIGTVSTEYTRENVVERVKELTGGQSVPVVYDSVGKDTFFASLECLRPRGLMVSYGNSSGAVPPISLLELSKRGSLYVTRPTLMNYTTSREELLANAAELFEVVASGAVKIEVNQTYALKDAAQAHRDLEARKTTGSTVLIP